jgi:hypothetical protein
MKKVVILAVIAAVTMSMSAQAETRHKQRVAANDKEKCWIVTDTLGHGFWQSCGNLTPAQRALLNRETLAATEGGGGGGGGR